MTLIKDTLKENKRLYRISKIISDLSEETKVMYKTTHFYSKDHEKTIKNNRKNREQ